jgi:activator of 2-hydroxyglutaryl-CoA dehydratase
MPLIAGIDIGNATTEVALAQDGRFIGSGIVADRDERHAGQYRRGGRVPAAGAG